MNRQYSILALILLTVVAAIALALETNFRFFTRCFAFGIGPAEWMVIAAIFIAIGLIQRTHHWLVTGISNACPVCLRQMRHKPITALNVAFDIVGDIFDFVCRAATIDQRDCGPRNSNAVNRSRDVRPANSLN